MDQSLKPDSDDAGGPTADRIARDDAIASQYDGRPSIRTLRESGRIDSEAARRAEQLRTAGPPPRPFRKLIDALRAERERQGLSLATVAERTGIDRAAIHKLEIGLNANPTLATLSRYADALGARIEWDLKIAISDEPAKAVGN